MHVIVENTVCLNTGDAAILIAIRKILAGVLGEKTKIYVFDSDPEVSERLYKKEQYPNLEFRKLLPEALFKREYEGYPVKNLAKRVVNRISFYSAKSRNVLLSNFALDEESLRSLELYRTAHSVITTGGTYLVENYNLWKRIAQFHIDDALGKGTIFFTQSLGPFHNDFNRRNMRKILNRSPLILLRDEKSLSHISSLVADRGKCHVVADAVFALADTSRIERILRSAKPPAPTGRVAVSVRNWNYVRDRQDGMRRYMDAVGQMVASLVRQGKQVTFVSTCQGVPEYAHDDSRTAEAIVDRLDPSIAGHVAIDRSFHTPDELMKLAKGFDFVVATRMHMMILSLCVGTPVLPIAYEFKTRELAARLGLSEVLLDIDTISADEAVAKLKIFSDDLEEFRRSSLESVLKENASALSSAELFARAVQADRHGLGGSPIAHAARP
jgi:colanic acid/amylovoran biosynthesis protein